MLLVYNRDSHNYIVYSQASDCYPEEKQIRLFLKYFIYTTLYVRKLQQFGCFSFHISYNNRTDYHNKTEISFKVALNSYNPIALITPLMVTWTICFSKPGFTFFRKSSQTYSPWSFGFQPFGTCINVLAQCTSDYPFSIFILFVH